jgi:hypothetical protein
MRQRHFQTQCNWYMPLYAQDFAEYMSESRAAADYFWALVSAVVYAGNLLVNKAATASPEVEGGPSKEPVSAPA